MSDISTPDQIAGALGTFPGPFPATTPEPPQRRWNTAWAWVLAVFPLVSWIPPYLVLFGAGSPHPYNPLAPLEPATLLGTAAANGLSLVLLVLPLAFTIPDARRLRSWGHARVAHPAWVLLSPVAYLVVRTVHLNRAIRRGSTPLWVGTAATVVGIVLSTSLILAATWGAMAEEFESTLAHDAAVGDAYAAMEYVDYVRETIEADYRPTNAEYTVACPGVTSAEAGSTFLCELRIPDGAVVRRLQIEMSTDGSGAFSYWPLVE